MDTVIQDAEIVQEAPVLVKEEKVTKAEELTRVYRAAKCTDCGEPAIFFPVRNKTICIKCLGVEGTHESNDIKDYLPEQYLKEAAQKEQLSKFSMMYKDPRSNPMYEWPGRNEPCLCGSGAKFKKCCMMKLQSEFEQHAIGLHESHRAKESINIANEIKHIRTAFAHFRANSWKELPESELKWEEFKLEENSNG